eukprot:gene8687-8868_t
MAFENTCDDDDDDVDAFLDSLLLGGTATKAATATSAVDMKESRQASTLRYTTDITSASNTASKSGIQSSSSHQQQQQLDELAEQEGPEAAEEAELLGFAESLDWQELIGSLDDDQLAAAFTELEAALEQGTAAGNRPQSVHSWRRCFVTAANNVALRSIAAPAANEKQPSGPSRSHNTRSEAAYSSASSSASQIRKAAAAASRRQQLVERLSCLTSNSSLISSKAKGGGSLAGEVNAAALTADHDSCCLGTHKPQAVDWDSSTRAGGYQDNVAHLTGALKTLDAGEALAENPDLKSVHSMASVRSMLSRLEPRQP